MYIKHKDVSIFYIDEGSGPALLLLHGFLENKEMWTPMIPALSQTHRVIAIDLLGHGQSECLGYVHTMEQFSDAVLAVIKHLELDRVSIIGHSMGGYVGLAFAKAYPEKINALCLLNSTPEDDDRERKELRARANKMAKRNYSQLVRMSVANLFDSSLKEAYKSEIENTINEALKTPVQGYIAANSGMSLRPESIDLWRSTTIKKGIILGQSDWIIDAAALKNKLKDYSDFFEILEGGHMLHITNSTKLLSLIIYFLKK